MSLAGAASGAASGLKQILMERFQRQQEAARVQQAQVENEQQQQRLGLQQQQEARMMAGQQADEADRTSQRARQTQQDDVAAADRRTEGNERGVMQMMGQGLQQIDGATKPNRNQIMGMLTEIGKPPTADLLKDPEADRAEYEAREGIQHKNRMAEIGAQGAESRRTQSARPSAAGPTEGPSPYMAERNVRNLQSVDELLPKVSRLTVGFGTDTMGSIGGTPARNFKSELDTLKANIGFGELTAMREASKTGGALGQVSDREIQLLSAALGGLDQGQSPENFKQQLQKVRDSINRWEAAQAGQSAGQGAPNGRASGAGPAQGQNGPQRWGRDAQGRAVRLP